jgi:hypothetical protein
MPSNVCWPFSDHHTALLRESCVNPCSIIESNGRAIVSKSRHSFTVSISRDAWIQMLNNRFISFLHSLSDNQLNAEMKWAEKNLPENIEFNDVLECVVFE